MRPLAIAALFLTVTAAAAAPAVAEPIKWTGAAGVVSLTIPDGWSMEDDGTDLVLRRHDKADEMIASCTVDVASIPNLKRVTQDAGNELIAKSTAESTAGGIKGMQVLRFSNAEIVGDVRLKEFDYETIENGQTLSLTNRSFGVVDGGWVRTVQIVCGGPKPLDAGVRKEIRAFLTSLAINRPKRG